MSDNRIIMSNKDMRIIKGMKPSKSDLIKEEKMFTNTVKKYMGAEIEVELEDGSIENQPLVDLVVAKKIAYDLEHPEKIDLKMYSQVMGEDTKTVDVNVKSAKELFGDIVVDADVKEIEEKVS
jgi:hypothetical protein